VPTKTAAIKPRCAWPLNDPLMLAYHDKEWGVPERDDRALYEKLILDGFQAGLSWRTILHKRENFRKAYRGFDPEKVARFTKRDRDRLMADAGIIRNRAKVEGSITSAKAYLEILDTRGSFSEYIWQFTDGRTIVNHWKTLKQLPAETKESQTMSKQLKIDGFKFCGPTICYAFMQAIGMVNDHIVTCFRHAELARRSR